MALPLVLGCGPEANSDDGDASSGAGGTSSGGTSSGGTSSGGASTGGKSGSGGSGGTGFECTSNAEPGELVEIAAGEFIMGCNEAVDGECDRRRATDARRVALRILDRADGSDAGRVHGVRHRRRVRASLVRVGLRSDRSPGDLHRREPGERLLRVGRAATSQRGGVGEGSARRRRREVSLGQRRTRLLRSPTWRVAATKRPPSEVFPTERARTACSTWPATWSRWSPIGTTRRTTPNRRTPTRRVRTTGSRFGGRGGGFLSDADLAARLETRLVQPNRRGRFARVPLCALSVRPSRASLCAASADARGIEHATHELATRCSRENECTEHVGNGAAQRFRRRARRAGARRLQGQHRRVRRAPKAP